jgi:hypothetical protein
MHGLFNPGPAAEWRVSQPERGNILELQLCVKHSIVGRIDNDSACNFSLGLFLQANRYSTAEGDGIASSRYCEIKGTIANNPAPIEKKAANG